MFDDYTSDTYLALARSLTSDYRIGCDLSGEDVDPKVLREWLIARLPKLVAVNACLLHAGDLETLQSFTNDEAIEYLRNNYNDSPFDVPELIERVADDTIRADQRAEVSPPPSNH